MVVLAVVLGAVIVLGGLVGFQWIDDRSNEVAAEAGAVNEDGADPTPAPTVPPTSVDPAPSTSSGSETPEVPQIEEDPDPNSVQTVACPGRYSELICDAAEFVQQARGRPFKEFPNIELLEDAEFDRALVEDLDESKEDLVEDERLLKSLGLLPLDLDLFATFQSLLESGVVGFYDPDDGRLVVRGGEFDLYGQSILVHELVHAFDDQWFDLSRDDFANEDAEYGYVAVIEGNATRVEERWREALSAEDRSLLTQQEFASLSPEDLQRLLSLPQILLNLQISPYQDGEVYVSALASAGGEQAVDDKFVDPPESSEEVLHPAASAEALAIADLGPPPVDGEQTGQGRLGELVFDLWLGQTAGDGWGGDSYVVWESGQETCITIDAAADSAADLAQIEGSAQSWAGEQPELRSVESIESVGSADGTDRMVVRITGCYR